MSNGRAHRRRARSNEWPKLPCAVCDLPVRSPGEAALIGGEGTGEFEVVHRALCLEVVEAVMGGDRRFEPIGDFLRRIDGGGEAA